MGFADKKYEQLFQRAFVFNSISLAKDSVPKREKSELFIEFQKNSFGQINLYYFEGITCNSCMNTISAKFIEIDDVLSVSMTIDFSEILIVSKAEIPLKKLQEIVSYDKKYKINKVK